jgi:predicted nuclease with TOPRIM domain
MTRWVAVIVAVAIAAGAGLLAGYIRWGMEATQVQRLQQRLHETDAEAAALREQKQQLQEKVEQVAKEQERLAQENETLRKEYTTQQLVTGQGGELPARPPK